MSLKLHSVSKQDCVNPLDFSVFTLLEVVKKVRLEFERLCVRFPEERRRWKGWDLPDLWYVNIPVLTCELEEDLRGLLDYVEV